MSSGYITEGRTYLTLLCVFTSRRIGGAIDLGLYRVLDLLLFDRLNQLCRFPSLIEVGGCWIVTLEGAIRLPGSSPLGLLGAVAVVVGHLPFAELTVLPLVT